ncbi:MBL fold metallo-hydrolase [Halobacteriales archaeon SW_12_67_38]|nr:MAG: MBL fold metallo-hydrolase [Halobacteriales archaeon SW_12_67_38]
MNLRFLGGAREVGRSAVLVNDSLLLDYGMRSGTPPGFPVGSVDPEAVARTLARDTLKLHGGSYRCPFTETDVKRVTEVATTHGYRKSFTAAGHEITFFDAGHIPGSAHVLVDDGETRLLYSGDFHTGSRQRDDSNGDATDHESRDISSVGGQRLVPPTTARPEADVVICESTYSDVEHEHRAAVEEGFVESVRTTLWEGGTVVIPAFAIGRTQELLLVCEEYDIPCYVDGMGQRVTEMLRQYPEFVRDADALRRATSHARFVTGRDGQRERIATGYQVEGTPGRELLDTGRVEIDGRRMPVSAQVESYDFSAHADREGLFGYLDSYRDGRVLVNHGDRCQTFAAELRDEGIDAAAPGLGDTVEV